MKQEQKELFRKLVDQYASYEFSVFAEWPVKDWGNKEDGLRYLERYWLDENEYKDFWQGIQRVLFVPASVFSLKRLFPRGMETILLRGGATLTEDKFENLKNCMKALNDKSFAVIENTAAYIKPEDLPLQFKYPSDITWEEVNSGNFFSTILFRALIKEYCVFGDSGKWGLYAANDRPYPLTILGFMPEDSELFRTSFQISEKEEAEMAEWLNKHG